MKASELIQELQKAIAEHGDLRVVPLETLDSIGPEGIRCDMMHLYTGNGHEDAIVLWMNRGAINKS